LGVTLRSRLYEMCKLVEMNSDDYRKAIKQAGYKFRVE
jgi:DNA replication protein DnaC